MRKAVILFVPAVLLAQTVPAPSPEGLAYFETHIRPLQPRAGKLALIRHATYDLAGLPPTPAEIDAFLKDASPKAFEKAVDRRNRPAWLPARSRNASAKCDSL